MSNSGLELISRYLPNLEELNLRHVRRLSKFGLNRVVSGCKKLRRVYTTPVSGAVNYLRQKKEESSEKRQKRTLWGSIHRIHNFLSNIFNI